jgi:hypothetical protein
MIAGPLKQHYSNYDRDNERGLGQILSGPVSVGAAEPLGESSWQAFNNNFISDSYTIYLDAVEHGMIGSDRVLSIRS